MINNRDFPIELIEQYESRVNKTFRFKCDLGETYKLEAVFDKSKRAGMTAHLNLFLLESDGPRWIFEADEKRNLNNDDDLIEMAEDYIQNNLIPFITAFEG